MSVRVCSISGSAGFFVLLHQPDVMELVNVFFFLTASGVVTMIVPGSMTAAGSLSGPQGLGGLPEGWGLWKYLF